jgi:hypothetical protein
LPRKLRPPKKRRPAEPDVPACLYHWLLWRDWRGAVEIAKDDDDSIAVLYFNEFEERPCWHAIERRALEEWIEEYPGTRPESFWLYSAPELRRLTGGSCRLIEGATRCHKTGIPYFDWFGVTDLPLVESEPAFLDRFNLWLPGERARVPADAFASKRFTPSLTWASGQC